MSEDRTVATGGRHGIGLILIGAILAVAVVLVVANTDALIDAVPFYVNIPVFAVVFVIVGLIAVFLWVQGHRVWAQSKGYSGLLGLVLGVLVVVGIIVLLVLPARRKVGEGDADASETSAREEEAALPAEE